MAIAVIGAILSVNAALFFHARMALSVAFGTALSLANLFALGKVIRAMLPDDEDTEVPTDTAGAPRKRGSAAAWGVFAALKMVVLFGLVFVVVDAGWIHLLGFLVGYGALPLGIVTAQLVRGMSVR